MHIFPVISGFTIRIRTVKPKTIIYRGIRQFCGAERSQVRIAEVQGNHTGLAIRAFLRFEVVNLKKGYSRFEAKTRIIRDAVRAYLADPIYVLPSTA